MAFVFLMSLAHSPKKLCAFFVPFDGVDGPWFSLSTRPRIVAEQIAGGAQNKGIRNLHMVNLKFASIFCKSREKKSVKKDLSICHLKKKSISFGLLKMVWGCNCGKIPSIPFVWKRLNLLPEDYFQNVLCYAGRSVWHKIPLPYHCRKDFPQFVFLFFLFLQFMIWFCLLFSRFCRHQS